jgi:hypothetical protein
MPSWLQVSTEIERALVESFIRPEKRERWLELLQTAKGRKKLRASLAHFGDFDLEAIVEVASSRQNAAAIFKMLREFGAPATCYLISENSVWDATELDLETALQKVIGYGFGTIVSCKPGALAYFEGEGPSDRFILRKLQQR